MNVKVVRNWRTVLARAWSMYGTYAVFASGLAHDYVIPYLQGRGWDGAGFGTFVSVLAAVTVLLRVLDQAIALMGGEDGDKPAA